VGKRLDVPFILGVDWWWLFIAAMAESYMRHRFHAPFWLPTLCELLFVGQAMWLKIAEPRSRTIYFYLVAGGLWTLEAIALPRKIPATFEEAMDWIATCLLIAGIFVFRAELDRHFKETDPHGIELNSFLTLFLSVFYFQYWFHQIYLEQRSEAWRQSGTVSGGT